MFTLFTCNWSIPHIKRNIRHNLYWLSWVTRSFWHIIDFHTNNVRERDRQFKAHTSSISVTERLVARALRSQSFDGRLFGLHNHSFTRKGRATIAHLSGPRPSRMSDNLREKRYYLCVLFWCEFWGYFLKRNPSLNWIIRDFSRDSCYSPC
jgi:hypothetical protein